MLLTVWARFIFSDSFFNSFSVRLFLRTSSRESPELVFPDWVEASVFFSEVLIACEAELKESSLAEFWLCVERVTDYILSALLMIPRVSSVIC